MKFLLSSFVAILLVTSCNPLAGNKASTETIATFHSRYNDAKIDEIIIATHPDFKSTVSTEDAKAFFSNTRDILGPIVSTKKVGWSANSHNLVTTYSITHETQFENGRGVETFTIKIKDDKGSLVGWHINSPALLKVPTPGTP